MILLDVFLRKLEEFGLNLHGRDPALGPRPIGKDKRDDAAARSQFDDPVVFADAREAGQKNGIERKAISLLLLANEELSAK